MSTEAHGAPRNRTLKWINDRMPIVSMIEHTLYYPVPRNLNYLWNFGSLAGLALVIMIVTGIVLSMHYTPHTDYAFDSVERIMRDVNYGWLIRYVHMNGGSMFFIVVYLHIFRGLYYGSFKAPRELLWWLGVIILFLMMASAFMGYVLPWGQMSFWAAKVITSMVGAVPLVGESLTELLWGGFTVDNPTLNRFYSLHYLLPFVIFGVVILHIWALHTVKANNPLGIDMKGPQDSVDFHPYYTVKDLFGVGVFLLVFAAFVFYAPNYLGHPDNYIQADPLKTPPHIVPEWYFLPFYTILRSFTDDWWLFQVLLGWWGMEAKLAGVLAMGGAVAVLFVLPWLDSSKVRSAKFRPLFRVFFWLFAIDCLILGWIGAQPAEQPWTAIGQWATLWYFAYFLVMLPLISRIERPKPLPHSISQSVLGGGGGAAVAAAAAPMEKSR